ncbi:MAG: hypothetical protein JXQ76_08175 [Campylobacterales bacterium]|nr:hypothetical protein [Campylobacterales bacterium]
MNLKTTLTDSDIIQSISSDYITNGRAKESWKINKVEINDNIAIMDVSMSTFYDQENFHLSIYLAEEMASQLMIIYGHIWAGLKEKSDEVWMLESFTKSIRPITDKDNITVRMEVPKMKRLKDKIFGIGEYQITDATGGLIELKQKGILS